MANSSQDVLDRIEAEKEGYLEELKDYIRIPSISTDPAYRDDVWRASEFLLGKIASARFYADHILSRVPGVRDSIVDGAAGVTGMVLEAF